MDTPILGLDLDGVVADYVDGIRHLIAEDRGIGVAELGEPTQWDFSNWGITFDEFKIYHHRAVVENRLFKNAQPIAGAIDEICRLKEAGVFIRIITQRLLPSSVPHIVVADTAEWLYKQQLPYDDICFAQFKYTVYADLYIDDSPQHLSALNAHGKSYLIFDQPYNQISEGPRAYGWVDAGKQILSHLGFNDS